MQKVFINQGLDPLSIILNEYKFKKIFLIIGKNSYIPIKNQIESFFSGIRLKTFIINEKNYKTVISGCESLKKSNSDLVIAIGGGRIIDTAKLISAMAFTNDNYEMVIKGEMLLKNKFLPLLVMPTTAGSGSESTNFSVMYYNQKKYSIVSPSLLPDFVIVDALLVENMPTYLKACSFFDALAQAIESFWSINSTPSSKKYAIKSMNLINKYKKNYLNNDPESIKYMVEAAYHSGKAINISKTTLPHALSYFFSIKHDIPHGHAVALTLGFIAKNNYILGGKNLRNDMVELSNLLKINVNDFDKFWYELMIECGLEIKLSKLGIEKKELELIVDSVNVERLKNHPMHIEKQIIIKELNKIF